jgi:hypothetical protein
MTATFITQLDLLEVSTDVDRRTGTDIPRSKRKGRKSTGKGYKSQLETANSKDQILKPRNERPKSEDDYTNTMNAIPESQSKVRKSKDKRRVKREKKAFFRFTQNLKIGSLI